MGHRRKEIKTRSRRWRVHQRWGRDAFGLFDPTTCREILKLRQALWTFVRHAGVEPTNNAAERAIRPGVLWRQGSFGTQSAEGSRVVDVMMTVVATLKQQHRTVLDYVTAACEVALCAQPAPSLLPTPEALEQLMRPAA
jgi:hypothetical protein